MGLVYRGRFLEMIDFGRLLMYAVYIKSDEGVQIEYPGFNSHFLFGVRLLFRLNF